MSFIKNGSNYDFIWQDIDEKDLAVRLNNWGFSKANFFRVIILLFNKTLEKTEDVLNLITKAQQRTVLISEVSG